MKQHRVRFPVICPLCGRESLVELPAASITAAIDEQSPIRLRAACHDVSWDAAEFELEQIREYLGVACLAEQRGEDAT